MADLFSRNRRSEIMSRIGSTDTIPEVKIRSVLHRMGYRFRLHRKNLPGKPDIVLPRWNAVILVHGCFWHGHDCCEGHIPKSNRGYWAPKLENNRRRDSENAEKLRGLGWHSIVVWECQTYSLRAIEKRLREAFAQLPTEMAARSAGAASPVASYKDDVVPILSFFSGAGGLDHGFRSERFRVLLACDNFPAAVQSYNLNAKRRVARVTDLASITMAELEEMIAEQSRGVTPQGVVGGPPCQGFSRGNAQANPRDPRNLLPFRYAELLRTLNDMYKLKFFVFENVMGLLYPRHRRRFAAICRAFRKAGFNVFCYDLDAQDFGVAQLRRRLFVVGLNSTLFPATRFVFPAGHVRKVTVKDVIGGLPEPAFFERGLRSSQIAYHPNHWTMQPRSSKFATETATDGRSFRRLVWEDVSPTVAYGNREIHLHPNGGRRLSVHEAMLLQGFPPTYRLTGNFSEQITQVSNAVPPPVAQVLARAVRRALQSEGRS